MGTLALWLRRLLAGAILSAVVLSLAPKGKGQAALRFLTGVLLSVLLLQPLREWKPERAAAFFSRERLLESALREETEQLAESVYRSFIQRETEEYIWNAAAELGVKELGVRIVLADGEVPYPYQITLRGTMSESQREQLAFLLSGELGIPPERQDWSSTNACEPEKAVGK